MLDSVWNSLVAKPDVANAVAAVASAVLAAVACLIALISLVVSHKTLRHQRNHNRLSVRPIATIAIGDYENRLFVKIVNNGVGPLVVKRIKVPGATAPEKALIFEMPELLPRVLWTNFVEDTAGRSIPPGSELVLLDLNQESSESPGQFTLSRDQVRSALGNLSVEVLFTDIYDTTFPPVVRSLKWFHRHERN